MSTRGTQQGQRDIAICHIIMYLVYLKCIVARLIQTQKMFKFFNSSDASRIKVDLDKFHSSVSHVDEDSTHPNHTLGIKCVVFRAGVSIFFSCVVYFPCVCVSTLVCPALFRNKISLALLG